VLAPISGKGEESRELNQWLHTIEKTRDAAERKRLFYVACTRAREELHLFASPEAKSNGSTSPAYGSLLSAAWPAAEPHFATSSKTSEDGNEMFLLPNQEVSDAAVGDVWLSDLAAEAVTERPAMLERLPLKFRPSERFAMVKRLSYEDSGIQTTAAHFERPEGSFDARAFGNAVHTFLEATAKRLAHGVSAEALLNEVVMWEPRISAVLRGEGLASARVRQLASRVRSALEDTLRDEKGLWILTAREEASSEFALTSWAETRRSVRLDRIFRAGATPLADGDDYLWIVDYKTTTHGGGNIEAFLQGERAKYSAQMETYARVFKMEDKVRLALYYPLLSQLIWWAPEIVG
jgi:ATP-dependent helicase/nuclease subunit A